VGFQHVWSGDEECAPRGGVLTILARTSVGGFPGQQSELPHNHMPAFEVEPDMPWDDETLVAGLKRRDSGAVQFAVETYAPKLYRFAIYQLGDVTAAEDVVSEVVTRMLEKIDGYKQAGAPFQAWLFTIARNLITDMHRRKKKAPEISFDAPADLSEANEMGALDERLESLADRDALLRAMNVLTYEQRQIVTLRLVEGWQPPEIARFLGRSINSVKSLQ